MASYVSAQGYKSLDEVPQKALDLAREEALKATFRDANGAARFINDVKKKRRACREDNRSYNPICNHSYKLSEKGD